MFTLSHLSRAPFRLNTSSEELEHVTLAAIAPCLSRVDGRLCPFTQKSLNESTGRYLAKNAASLELGVQYCARQLTSFQLRFMELTHSCEFPSCQEN